MTRDLISGTLTGGCKHLGGLENQNIKNLRCFLTGMFEKKRFLILVPDCVNNHAQPDFSYGSPAIHRGKPLTCEVTHAGRDARRAAGRDSAHAVGRAITAVHTWRGPRGQAHSCDGRAGHAGGQPWGSRSGFSSSRELASWGHRHMQVRGPRARTEAVCLALLGHRSLTFF